MAKGVAPLFCEHFPQLRERLQSEEKARGFLAAICIHDEQCWINNLITKKFCYEKPTMEDLEETLWRMKEHGIANNVLEIHLPRIACGKGGMKWKDVRAYENVRNRTRKRTKTLFNPKVAREYESE